MNIIRTATAGAALAVVFAIAIVVAPSPAKACWNNQCYAPYYYQDRNTYTYPVYQPVPQPVPYPYPYPQPVPQPIPQPTYYPLTVSCYANPTTVSAGNSVTWTAYASGGTGSYSYSWSGINNSGYNNSATAYSIYYNPGSYSASVTVTSNGQTVTQSCGSVSVTGNYTYNYPQYYTQPTYTYVQPQNTGGLVAACFADRTNAVRGQTVTWAVEVTGGTGQYTYAWSGTDSLSGTGLSVQKAYETLGSKNASVLITSTDGQTVSQACGDAVQVRAAGAPAPAPAPTVTNNTTNLSASAFGLGNLPWGWIAILLIIILMVTVFYLLFNRHPKA